MGTVKRVIITSTGWDWGPRVTTRSEHRDIGVFFFFLVLYSWKKYQEHRILFLGGPVVFEWIEWRWLFFLLLTIPLRLPFM